jgi:MEMO1 family protein
VRSNKPEGPEGLTIRPPAVAGAFYPSDPVRLRREVSALLAAASSSAAPKAVIAPHAGYAYSGRVAAEAFAALRADPKKISRVVLIGPAHYVRFRGIAVPTFQDFATPLGLVPLDEEAVKAIADLDLVVTANAPHGPEHALEVELPFLQLILPSFRLAPLLVGDAPPRAVADALRRLWGGGETLIVVSSDLSHYLDYDRANRLDLETAAAIERGDWATLAPSRACGHLAIAGLLQECERVGLSARRLRLCNSGDATGSRDRVVGYGAWAFA